MIAIYRDEIASAVRALGLDPIFGLRENRSNMLDQFCKEQYKGSLHAQIQ